MIPPSQLPKIAAIGGIEPKMPSLSRSKPRSLTRYDGNQVRKKVIMKFRQKKPSIMPHTVRCLNRSTMRIGLASGLRFVAACSWWLSWMIASSASLTAAWNSGRRYHAHQPMAHRTPSAPANRNTARQPHRPMISAISGVATALPMRAPLS